ncbi:multidrug resistance 1 2 3 (p glyco 1 2 3) [Fusarium beomiforme]|uniref:Multidrug resistance 1 2 3 (P glyco 1 2 3) n=1 Tax=Fusarium beomiforme TaxID=44412 RepID=A0A9P5ABA7_9HYPO|nr:multidrug resistance 1 2 3 (p glyco 1 2 3) [Fusarium beomiforme]
MASTSPGQHENVADGYTAPAGGPAQHDFTKADPAATETVIDVLNNPNIGRPPTHSPRPSTRSSPVSAASQVPPEKKKKTLRSFFTYFQLLFYADPSWIDILLLVVGTLAACAAGSPFPVMAIIFGQLVNDLNTASCDNGEIVSQYSPKELQDSINEKVVTITWIGVISFALIYTYIVSWSIFSRRLENRIRDRYFMSILLQDATFFDKRQAGEITSRLNADIQAIQSGTSEKVGIILGCISFFISSYVVAFVKNTTLAGILVSLVPAFMLLATLGSMFTAKFVTAMSEKIASASSIASETLANIPVVQAFGAGPRLEAIFAERMKGARKQGINKAFVAAIQAGMLYFIAYSANALAFWQGSTQIANMVEGNGGASVGDIYTVILVLVDACVVLGGIAPLLPLLGAAVGSFEKLREDMDSPANIDTGSDRGEKLSSVEGNVSFRNVSFAYVSRPHHSVLKNVSFDCPAGKHTALVGLSGSGKSTVAGLTSRIYDPTEGTVLLDGHDLKDLNVKGLRSHMSLVQQEPSLLDRSIVENIALGILNSPQPQHERFKTTILGTALAELAAKLRQGEDLATAAQGFGQDMVDLVERVQEAARLADASGFVGRLEYGYGTLVGTGGKLVSGGQRQRLALARALIRDPKVLILDEATASLDSASERRIQMAIESIAKNRTVIAIAHRLSTIKNADNIIVMNNGEIIEQGNHLELMTLDRAYASMVRLQTVDSEDAGSTTSTLRTDNIHSEKDSITELKTKDIETEVTDEVKEENAKEKEDTPEGDAALDSNKSAWTVMKSISGMVRPYLLLIIVCLFAATIVGLTFSSSGLIFGYTIDNISPCNPVEDIRWAGRFFGGMWFLIACVELLANTTSWTGFGMVAEKLLYKIRVLCFRSLYEQDLDWHQSEGRTPTALLSVITTDAATVGGFSGSIIGTIFSIVVNFLVAIILSHILAWKIAIVCLVIVPILLGCGIMQLRSLSKFERRHAGAFSGAVGIANEAVNSFKTISSLSIEEEVMTSYRRALRAPRKEITLASMYANLWLALANSTGNLIYAFAYWWGSTRITAGEASQREFFIILICMLVSAQLWGQMFSLAPEVSRARAAASRILSLINLGSSKDDAKKGKLTLAIENAEKDVEAHAEAPPKSSGSKGATIVFKDVKFSYPARPHIQILTGMYFTISAGQFVGLVGPSGAGKSTIMSLVQRMYRPSSGTVEINGVDICAREGTEFRNDIAVVPQDCALFDGTIRFNVALGSTPDHEPTDEEIHQACKLANIHDVIMELPNGYDTECGPNGSRLSGGQRQRLAIARALVRKPKLLLLDESTSALDAESERALQEGLERVARGITVIAITHRLHTVRKADVIFMIEGGKVVEKGRHEDRPKVAIIPSQPPLDDPSSLQGVALTTFQNRINDAHPRRGGSAAASLLDGPVPVPQQHHQRDSSANTSNSDPQSEQFELVDYPPIQARRVAEDRETRRQAKRDEKRRWLEEQDEMKFSHSIQFNAVPDWSSHYIAYSNLKKLIYHLEKTAHQARGTTGDAESRPLINQEDAEEVFSRALGVELEKICSFYVSKEGELLEEAAQLLRDVGDEAEDAIADNRYLRRLSVSSAHRPDGRNGFRSRSPRSRSTDNEESASEEEDETTGLTTRRRSSGGRRRTLPNIHKPRSEDLNASSEFGRDMRRHSTTADENDDQALMFSSGMFSSGIMLKKRIISLYVSLCELKSFIQLNRTGFAKVLKKFDKILDKELKGPYLRAHVETAYPFKDETKRVLEEHITKMEKAYAEIVTGGDEELARKDLRSHLREHVVWERNTVWRDLIGIERRAEAAGLGQALLGQERGNVTRRLQGDEDKAPKETQFRTPLGKITLPPWLASSSLWTLVACLTVFFLLLLLPIMEKPEQQNCLAMLVFVSLLWATETIPLFVTSLLIPFLSVVLNVVRDETPGKPQKRLDSKQATSAIFAAMWTPVIMLLLGGFTLAAALSKCTIDKRLATLVLSKAGTQPKTVLIANMFVAAFASMLISNVAAPVLCYSIIEPMLRTLPSDSNMSKAVIIGIALASNIGGMLSPIASPQNVVAMGIMQPAPTWLQWFFIVIPVGALSIVLIWLLLLVTFQPGKGTTIAPIRPVKEKFTGLQWFVTIVTISTIALWCASHQLEAEFGDMGVIAIIPIVLFFGIGILTKEDFNNFPWTIIILAAGGLSLGKAVRSSGLLHTLAEIVSEKVEGMSLYGVLVVFSTLILVIATFISHTVAALIFLPLVFDVGVAMDQPHPNLLVMGGVLMCSAAMGLPTSGFPNMTAIMKEDPFGQRYLQVKHFISRGVPSSIITLIVVVTLGYGIMQVAGLD